MSPAGAVHDGGVGPRPHGEYRGRGALPAPLAAAGGDESGTRAVAPAGGRGTSLGRSGSPPGSTGPVQGGAQEPLRCAAHGSGAEPGDHATEDRSAETAYGCVRPALLNRSVF